MVSFYLPEMERERDCYNHRKQLLADAVHCCHGDASPLLNPSLYRLTTFSLCVSQMGELWRSRGLNTADSSVSAQPQYYKCSQIQINLV